MIRLKQKKIVQGHTERRWSKGQYLTVDDIRRRWNQTSNNT